MRKVNKIIKYKIIITIKVLITNNITTKMEQPIEDTIQTITKITNITKRHTMVQNTNLSSNQNISKNTKKDMSQDTSRGTNKDTN